MNAKSVFKRLKQVGANSRPITPRTLRENGETTSNTTGERSRFARLRADTPLKLKTGRQNPARVAVPAYQQYTTDGTAGNTETITLDHNLIDSPVTESVDVWEAGEHVGQPDAIDYANDTIDYTDDGTSNTLHIWYMTDAAATLEVEKSTPGSSKSSRQELYTAALRLVNRTDQTEQPEYIEAGQSKMQEWVAQDMTLDFYIDAPYNVRLTDPDGSGAYPTNARLSFPAMRGKDVVKGLPALVKADMG